MMLFWSLKLVFFTSLSQIHTEREKKKRKRRWYCCNLIPDFSSRPCWIAFTSSFHFSLSSSSSSLFYSCFEIHSYIYVYIFWFDCAVLIKQWNWITTGSSLTMFVSTFRSFSPSSFFFFCCIDFLYSMKLYLESICFINFHNLFEFLIEWNGRKWKISTNTFN